MAFVIILVACIVFCLNLVSIVKRIKYEEKTSTNTFWLTTSFTFLVGGMYFLIMFAAE